MDDVFGLKIGHSRDQFLDFHFIHWGLSEARWLGGFRWLLVAFPCLLILREHRISHRNPSSGVLFSTGREIPGKISPEGLPLT